MKGTQVMNRDIIPGSQWLHFKGYYIATVIAVAKHTETGESLVIYECYNTESKEPCGIYARPMTMFLSEVDKQKYPNAAQKYRFERVN